MTEVEGPPAFDPDVDHAALATMSAEEDDLRTAGRWTSAHCQLMDVLGLAHDEVTACAVLAWALDPLGPHGIGIAVLADLASELGLDPSGVARASVRCEVPRQHSRADVVISVPDGWTVVVEAKVHSAEGPTQCARLEADWPEPTTLVLLTRRAGQRPTTAEQSDRWTPLSWSWATATIGRHLGAPTPATPTEEAQASLILWLASARRNL